MLAVVCAASQSCCQPWKHVDCEQLLFRLGDDCQLLYISAHVCVLTMSTIKGNIYFCSEL